jgi:hypothetical protein
MNVGKLQIVSLRDAFRHEAHNFTAWLEANIDALAERVGVELTVLEREKSVGSFNVDLFCETSDGRYVIIENQLERSDHDHLGKLLTYLVNLDARVAIWVTPEVRPEHERVIDWLNESTSADFSFYLIQVEAVRIENSPFAPLFTTLVAPDEQTRQIGETKKKLAESEISQKRLKFWTQLFERSKGSTALFSNISPRDATYISTSAGKSGFVIGYNVRWDKASVWFGIDLGPNTEDKSKAVFEQLYAQKDQIEAEFGAPFEWTSKEGQRACFATYWIADYGGVATPETWPELQNAMIEAMIRLDRVFRSRISDF